MAFDLAASNIHKTLADRNGRMATFKGLQLLPAAVETWKNVNKETKPKVL